jgi:RNA polymerase sigma-70 factor (ECF subfamily)
VFVTTQTLPAALDRDAVLASSRPALERLARRLVWDDEEAHDLVQSAMVDALSNWRPFAEPGDAEAWLRRLVTNRALSHLRRRRFWAVISSLMRVDPPPPEAPDTAAERAAHLRALARAVETLSPRQAAAFSLRYLEGLSLDETAEALDLNRGTLRVHLQRAVAALRAKGVL